LKENINKSAYRGDITKHLDSSVRYLHHILPYSSLLKKDKVYDIINAQTLETILETSLKTEKDGIKSYSYDFRTVELARLLLELSVRYLEQNPYLKPEYTVPKNIKESIITLSEFFKMLSNLVLRFESDETINKKNQERLQNQIKEATKKLENAKKTDSKWDKINRKHSFLSDQQIKLDNEFHDLRSKLEMLEGKLKGIKKPNEKRKLNKKIKEIKKTIDKNRKLRIPINKQILKLQDEREKITKPIKNEISSMQNVLSKKHDHLKPYFCRINGLQDFSYIDSPHGLEESKGL